SVAVASFAGSPLVVEAFLGDAVRLWREDAGAAPFWVKQAAPPPGRGPGLLPRHPQAPLPGPPPVFGVTHNPLGARRRRLAVGGGSHDQSVQGLHAPGSNRGLTFPAHWLHELSAQPVEELRMRRLFSLKTEVLGGDDESAAKEILPEAVDCYPCRQRILL